LVILLVARLRVLVIEVFPGAFASQFLFILGILKLIQQQAEQGGVIALVVRGGLLLGEAAKVGSGNLQSVEHEGGGFGLDGFVGESAHDLKNGELQAGGILEDGNGEVLRLAVGGVVEDAEAASAAGRSGAGLTVHLGVLATGGILEISRLVHVAYPLRGGGVWNQRVKPQLPVSNWPVTGEESLVVGRWPMAKKGGEVRSAWRS
jgi:hypothetical protein